jgi:hypothetical protein
MTSLAMEDIFDTLIKNKVYAFALVGAIMFLRYPKKKLIAHDDETDKSQLQLVANHDLQRIAAISHGGPRDHGFVFAGMPSNVVIHKNENFNLDKTIFKSVDSALNRMILNSKLGNTVYWSDGASAHLYAEFEKRFGGPPTAVLKDPTDKRIYDFMQNECNFVCEHADGSFLDHLHFCRDYSSVHYKKFSPMPMLLHSICGVATNLFPMDPKKLPILEDMVSKDDFVQILAFPSILRLLYDLKLLKALRDRLGDLNRLKKVKFHRVMDNQPGELTGEQFWIHLNYQVMHLMDFLPAAYWSSQLGDPLFGLFIDVYKFMEECGKLEATVNFTLVNPNEYDNVDGMPLSLGRLVGKYAPSFVQRALAAKSIRKWSKQKGHSLDFELIFD